MEEYINDLINQFKLATGSKANDVNSKQFINEFSDWIRSRQKQGAQYTEFIDFMGFRFGDSNCAEVGKGEHDTVVKPFDTLLITPESRLERINPVRVIDGHMRVFDAVPIIVGKRNGKNIFDEVPRSFINTYLTQNPYNQDSIYGWEHLHNSGDYNIIFGVYGSLSDKDIDSKIRYLATFKSLLNGEFKEDYGTSDDNYFYVVGSNRPVKRLYKEKTRTR